jgi:predicted phage-related endonuclease
MDSVVVSVRIKKEIKENLEGEGVNIESAIKEFLADRASQIELRKKIQEFKAIIEKNVKSSKRGFAVKSIREDRYAAH